MCDVIKPEIREYDPPPQRAILGYYVKGGGETKAAEKYRIISVFFHLLDICEVGLRSALFIDGSDNQILSRFGAMVLWLWTGRLQFAGFVIGDDPLLLFIENNSIPNKIITSLFVKGRGTHLLPRFLHSATTVHQSKLKRSYWSVISPKYIEDFDFTKHRNMLQLHNELFCVHKLIDYFHLRKAVDSEKNASLWNQGTVRRFYS